MIEFHVSRLAKEPVALTGEEPADFLEIKPTDQFSVETPVAYELSAELIRGGVLVTGHASTTIAGICGRCLEPVRQTVDTGELKLFFEIAPDQEDLDVTEDVRTEMLLAFPMNLLCSENCLGLCPVCGGNRNRKPCDCSGPIDPGGRWNALDGLKF